MRSKFAASRPAAIDNGPPIVANDVAVFDRGGIQMRLLDSREDMEWTAPRARRDTRDFEVIRDGPSDDHRRRAGQAWYSSERYRGQHANDNIDWPLAKLLRAEGSDYYLALAERYREMHDAANAPTELIGRDIADNIYLLSRTDLDESTGSLIDKGVKRVTGRRARPEAAATYALRTSQEQQKRIARPVAKAWHGDLPLLHRIDASRELAAAQGALGWLREAFEAAVVGGETLEAIGREHGVGNKTGAKGAGRALVYLGFQAVDEFWLKPVRRAE